MRISLVFPPFYFEPMYNLPPLGLVGVATGLKGAGHEIRIHDFVLAVRQGTLRLDSGIYDACTAGILENNPDVVGFGAQCTTYPAVVQIARRIKRAAPHVRIVVGGHNASFVDVETLSRYPSIDAVVRGEGEITFAELMAAYDAGSDPAGVEGLTWRDDGRITQNPDRELIADLDELPLPDYGFLAPLSEYRDACNLPRSIAVLEAGRGCPHRCVYCSESTLWRRRSRTYSVDRLVREMRNLRDECGAECVLLSYDQFTANRKFVVEFCERLLDEGLNTLPWYCISRLDTVDGPTLDLMHQAGCESMCYGIDSGSEKTLGFINKRIDRTVLFQRVSETTEAGIVPTLSYIVGFPEEERSDIDQTLELALRTGILGSVNTIVQLPTVLPGTDLHAGYRDRLTRGVDSYFSLGLEFNGGRRLPEDDELIDSDPYVFSSFFNVPCPGMNLDDLRDIADYFPLAITCYARSLFLLTRWIEPSPSTLFLRWLDWIRRVENRDQRRFDPHDCITHFRPFVEELLVACERGKADLIRDVAAYETAVAEAGAVPAPHDDFSIDLTGWKESAPLSAPGVVIRQFDHSMTDVIRDLREGTILGAYPQEKTLLVFRAEGTDLEVTEINDFGRDFLGLCNGERTLEEIASDLYPRYGTEMDTERFFQECVGAAEALREMKLLGGKPENKPITTGG